MSDIITGYKQNHCVLLGVQGVIETIAETNTESGTIFLVNGPQNNTQYVYTDFASGLVALMPEEPSSDFNFKLTIKKTGGFSGTLAGQVAFYYSSATAVPAVEASIKWDNPSFDVTDNYTVLHMHIWYDGLNYCGKIDGYVDT